MTHLEDLRTKQARVDALCVELESMTATLADAEQNDACARADALIAGRDYGTPSSLKALRQRAADLRAALPIAEQMLLQVALLAKGEAVEHFAPLEKKARTELSESRARVKEQIRALQNALEEIDATSGKRVEQLDVLSVALLKAKTSPEVLHAVAALEKIIEVANAA